MRMSVSLMIQLVTRDDLIVCCFVYDSDKVFALFNLSF